MKKLFAVLASLLVLTACGTKQQASEMKESVSVTLASETPDMSAYTFMDDQNPAFLEISVTEAIRIFEEKQNAILYFGRSNCPFCQRAVPELNTVAKEFGYYVYYIDVDMSKLTLSDYYAIAPYIQDSFVKETADSEGEFMIPDVIAVKDGSYVSSHVSLVDGYVIDSNTPQMSGEQKEELRDIYRLLFKDAGIN